MIQNVMSTREGTAFVKCTCTMLLVMMLGGKFKEEEENAASDTRLSDAMDGTLSVTMESFTGGRREP